MIRLVSSENIELFEKMREGLLRPLTKTSLGKYWTVDDLYTSILNKRSYGFYQEETGYSGAFYIMESPLRKTLSLFWAGKEISSENPLDYQELYAFFDTCAKHFQCDDIRLQGRPGWGKMIEPLGFKEDSRVYIKEV